MKAEADPVAPMGIRDTETARSEVPAQSLDTIISLSIHTAIPDMTSQVQKASILFALCLQFAAMTACDTVGQTQMQTDDTASVAPLDTVWAEGTFEGKEGINTSGTYKIGQSDENLVLELSDDFETESGPDLFVVLSQKEAAEATGANVLEGSAHRVDSLRALTGKQQYDLADTLDLESFHSVAIQCIRYSHLYGIADL